MHLYGESGLGEISLFLRQLAPLIGLFAIVFHICVGRPTPTKAPKSFYCNEPWRGCLSRQPASRAMGFLSFNTLFRWMRCDLDRQKHKLHAALTYAAEDDGAELENIWLIVKGKWNAPDLIRLRCCFTSHRHDRSRRLHATRRATQRFRCGFPA